MKDSYSIRDLINLFLGKIWTIAAVTVAFGIAAFCVAKFILPLKYSSHLAVYIQSYSTLNPDETQQSNVNSSKQLINTYIAVMKDDAVMAAVGRELAGQFDVDVLSENFSISGGEITSSSLRDSLSITSETDTSVLKVSATTRNAELSAAMCNALAKVSPQFIKKAVQAGSITTIGTAKVYPSPVSPNVKRITVIGMALGLALIMAEILVIDFFDNTVKSTQELSKKYNKSILGEIQNIGSEKDKKKKKKKTSQVRGRNLLTDKNVPFNVIESYKSIRTNITFSLATKKRKIIAVSSANPGEGKSTTAANIAIAFSQMENKVLLIDADMRKPVQHRTFKVSNSSGLSNLISQMSTVQESIKRNVMPNLDVLPAGTCPPNPSELLASEQFKDMLGALSVNYDYVIIDTPPVNVVSDAMVLSDMIGGILFVLKYGSTAFDDVDEAMKKVELADANMIGFILNDVKIEHRPGAYKYSYSNYGYGAQANRAAARTESENN